MYFSNDHNLWMTLIHLFITLFDTILAKYFFGALVLLIFVFISLKKRSYGEDSPKMKEAEQVTVKVTKYMGRIIMLGAAGFVVFQLARIYIID